MSIISRLFGKRESRVVSTDPPRRIRAGYDISRSGNETIGLWTNADSLNADACNSLAVRRKYRNASREERRNNGHCAGIIGTHTNYIIGTGAKVRVLTGSTPFNQMVETRWQQWCQATKFTSKLRTLCDAKTSDGEGVGILHDNPSLKCPVTLDVRLVECDQLTAPTMKADTSNYVDGVHFDNFGNPILYDILKQHPGSSIYTVMASPEYDTLPASHVIHWFKTTRSGQHRGIPELAASLSLFGTGRRYREAVVAAAETAADLAAVMQMGLSNQGADEVAPFTSIPIEKRMLMVSPAGATVQQMKAEQPTTTYEMFVRQMICEEARPLSMPYNIAACDSSGYSYSGGQLDHQTYFVSVGVERQDCTTDVLDKVFSEWFRQAVHAYGWNGPEDSTPRHAWMWNKKPQNDPVKTANSRKITLALGGTTLSDLYAEDGEDYEDKIVQMAADFGVTVEEMRGKLFEAVFPKSGGAPGMEQPKPDKNKATDDAEDGDDGNGSPAKANGHNRMADYITGANL